MLQNLLTVLVLITAIKCCVVFDKSDYISSFDRTARDINTNCGPNDTVPPNRVNTSEELRLVRNEMTVANITVLIVPLDEVGRLRWISGFSGSNGQAAITQTEARLWTDGRYFIQAADQLDCNWEMMKIGEDDSIEEWISQVGAGSIAGADPNIVGAGDWLDWDKAFEEGGVDLVTVENLIDNVWTEDEGRPPTTFKDIVIHDMKYAGEAWEDKVDRLRKDLVENKYFGMIVTELDEIAWLFNIRGEGNSHNEGLYHSPVFQSISLVTPQEIILWLQPSKVSDDLIRHLNKPECPSKHNCVTIKNIQTSLEDISNWVHEQDHLETLLVTKPSKYLSGANYAVYRSIPEDYRKLGDSPILEMKAIKNEVETAGMIEAHIRDAVALCDWAAMMEEQIEGFGAENWTEITASERLTKYREEQEDNKGLSFGTISAFGPNGAIIHYSPTPDTDAKITRNSMFMVDSGGQYLQGTTDVTRTFHYGEPSEDQVERYTDVLKGAIELARIVVPEKTQDTAVDLVTRQFLFNKGLDYRHGTGHGIGAYLEVHEGPILVRMKNSNPGKFEVGMFFSDEPGYYKEGEFGLRLETILRVVDFESAEEAYGKFIKFEPVTLVPFEPKLINFEMMSPEQIEWYNKYNQIIMTEVGTRLMESGKQRAYDWVEKRTKFVSPTESYVFKKWVSKR